MQKAAWCCRKTGSGLSAPLLLVAAPTGGASPAAVAARDTAGLAAGVAAVGASSEALGPAAAGQAAGVAVAGAAMAMAGAAAGASALGPAAAGLAAGVAVAGAAMAMAGAAAGVLRRRPGVPSGGSVGILLSWAARDCSCLVSKQEKRAIVGMCVQYTFGLLVMAQPLRLACQIAVLGFECYLRVSVLCGGWCRGRRSLCGRDGL